LPFPIGNPRPLPSNRQGSFHLGTKMILADYTNIELFSDHQSRDIIAQLILGSMVVLFTLSAIAGFFSKTTKPLQLSNNFDLGYVRDDEVFEEPQEVQIVVEEKDELKELKRQVEIAKLKKQLAELQKPAFDNNLMKDCVDALTGLGTPVRKAKAEAQNIFEKNPNIKTVQEFITEYGKR
jgi:hypothetical protein